MTQPFNFPGFTIQEKSGLGDKIRFLILLLVVWELGDVLMVFPYGDLMRKNWAGAFVAMGSGHDCMVLVAKNTVLSFQSVRLVLVWMV